VPGARCDLVHCNVANINPGSRRADVEFELLVRGGDVQKAAGRGIDVRELQVGVRGRPEEAREARPRVGGDGEGKDAELAR
jgi:hypothetical protein